jgi:hypothetical protein
MMGEHLSALLQCDWAKSDFGILSCFLEIHIDSNYGMFLSTAVSGSEYILDYERKRGF